jgi:hypothetical protein
VPPRAVAVVMVEYIFLTAFVFSVALPGTQEDLVSDKYIQLLVSGKNVVNRGHGMVI